MSRRKGPPKALSTQLFLDKTQVRETEIWPVSKAIWGKAINKAKWKEKKKMPWAFCGPTCKGLQDKRVRFLNHGSYLLSAPLPLTSMAHRSSSLALSRGKNRTTRNQESEMQSRTTRSWKSPFYQAGNSALVLANCFSFCSAPGCHLRGQMPTLRSAVWKHCSREL